jgi:hypothetical protein
MKEAGNAYRIFVGNLSKIDDFLDQEMGRRIILRLISGKYVLKMESRWNWLSILSNDGIYISCVKLHGSATGKSDSLVIPFHVLTGAS